MQKSVLVVGVFSLALWFSLSTGAAERLNEVTEFIKLLNEAEDSFLDEEYEEVREILEKAQVILDSQIEAAQEGEVFFDLSTPENAARSFLEASFLNEEEKAKQSWSKKVPEVLVSMTVSAIQKEMEEDAEEKPELVEPEMLRMITKTFRYEKERIGPDSYYVWATPPGEERSEEMQFRVIRENGDWKILGFKTWEEEDWFRSLIGEPPLEPVLQWAAEATASSEYSSGSWSAEQATGEPNTFECGDIATAWAPSSSGSAPEWLELTFETPVYATTLRVHETLNAGFIYKVDFVDPEGGKHTVWQGQDTTSCPGWFGGEFERTPYLVERVILHTQIGGYEEIDAVELTGVPASS